jgi:two-component system, OmpR family, response regulator
MKVLLVEDDAKTASFILKGLKEAGYSTEHARDGDDGLCRITTEPYDVVVADLMLPRMDGLTMIAEVRKRKLKTPTIVLSAKGSVDDRIKGLEAGADDYLVKPFSFSELLARIQALVRRATAVAEPTQLAVGDLALDILSREVTRQGQRIDLQPREFALLEYLMRSAGRVVSKTMIMEHVWDYNFDPLTNVVEARISRLRDKVDRPFDQKLIHTIRGVGYVLRQQT